jgi:alkanesulfonate monooxygenase SsuD/methylene tetrahydromethanopterin reductase-like flavin-dependent oxidoreductase (luciferase family)
LPIWIGGESEGALRRVVEFGRGWLAVANSFEAFRANRARLEAAATRAGRAFAEIDVQITTSYTPTLAAFREEARRYADLGHDYFMAPNAFWAQSLDETLRSLDALANWAAS